MFIVESLEITVIAIAKTYNQEIVSEKHLIIAVCEFLCKHEPKSCTSLIMHKAENARKIESAMDSSGFKPPIIPANLLARIKQCNDMDEVVSLAKSLAVQETKETSFIAAEEPAQITSMGDFHEPLGPSVGILPKIIPDKDTAARLIQSFLVKSEFYAWDGPYNTKDYILVTRPGQSMGRLFVTNKRLLFWSDDLAKPHVGLFYSDIQGWKTSWIPLKSRGVVAMVAGRKVIFVANSTAIEIAERYIKS
jgi:hypothetical protein